jgi:hypothetical protein
MHMCSKPTNLPPLSSKIWWSGRWDQQHDGVVLMVEKIHMKGFTYTCGVQERGGAVEIAAG